MRRVYAIVLTVSLVLILFLGVEELPKYGLKGNPANNEVMKHYIENAPKETGALNIVTGIILDYRAFDTFVEASVLFTAAIVVIMLLKHQGKDYSSEDKDWIKESTILKETGKIIIPFIQIFGLYIIFFGHLGPGGGFAGGTILSASLILYRIVYGNERVKQKFQYDKMVKILCGSIVSYGVLKGYSFIIGGSGIHLPAPGLGTLGNIISGGFLLPLNILIGTIVTITMYSFFSLFDRGEI